MEIGHSILVTSLVLCHLEIKKASIIKPLVVSSKDFIKHILCANHLALLFGHTKVSDIVSNKSNSVPKGLQSYLGKKIHAHKKAKSK